MGLIGRKYEVVQATVVLVEMIVVNVVVAEVVIGIAITIFVVAVIVNCYCRYAYCYSGNLFYRYHDDVTATLVAMIFAQPPYQQWNENARHQQRKEMLRRHLDVSVVVVESSNHHRSEQKWRNR